MRDLPPLWYSKLELFFIRNAFWVRVIGYLLVFVILPLIFMESEQLDPQLLIGIPD